MKNDVCIMIIVVILLFGLYLAFSSQKSLAETTNGM